MKDQLKSHQNAAIVELECQLADMSQQLLLEVTALRAKLAEMYDDKLNTEKIVRAHLKDDYDKLVQGMFNAVFQLNYRFDEFKYVLTTVFLLPFIIILLLLAALIDVLHY